MFIDEPEYSLHPVWQEKILKIYSDILSGESSGNFQMFISTHSPFIVHNIGLRDKLFVLKKNDIGFTEIVTSPTYANYSYSEVVKQAFNINLLDKIKEMSKDVVIVTEGKTDWMHIKNAVFELKRNGVIKNLSYRFLEYDSTTEMGDQTLLRFCKELKKLDRNGAVICIFDRDNKKLIKDIEHEGGIKHWGNNVFSFAIPIPNHRDDNDSISIEHYYSDEIIREYVNGKRLFTADEFDSNGIHGNKEVLCMKRSKCQSKSITILDSSDNIFEIKTSENVALTKNEFTELITKKNGSYKKCRLQSVFKNS